MTTAQRDGVTVLALDRTPADALDEIVAAVEALATDAPVVVTGRPGS